MRVNGEDLVPFHLKETNCSPFCCHRFDVHWDDQSDEIINETNREEPKCVLTVHCSYVQGFPLYFQGLDTWTSFSDCLSNTTLSSSNCTSRSLLVDCDHSFLSTRFYKPEHRGPFQNNIPPDKPFATNKERAHCNSRIRKSVGDTIAEMQSSSLVKAPMANEIYAWGDDGQTSLVRIADDIFIQSLW